MDGEGSGNGRVWWRVKGDGKSSGGEMGEGRS